MSQSARPPASITAYLQMKDMSNHAAQDTPTGGLRQLNPCWIEQTEGVDRQTLGAKLPLDERDDERTDLIQVSLSDVRCQDGEKRARLSQEQAFPAIQPDQVDVPVIMDLDLAPQDQHLRLQLGLVALDARAA
jgi:hypothetical protein